MWNVNVPAERLLAHHAVELIETLWNVNELEQHIQEGLQEELIETLWNVNSSIIVLYLTTPLMN